MSQIAIIGAGAWGTALAIVLRRNGNDVMMWALEPDVAMSIDREHENHIYMQGTRLDPEIRATNDVAEAVRNADLVLLVVPAQHMREACRMVKPRLPRGVPLLICTKGIEAETGALMSEVVAEELPGVSVAALSGPTFASEVAQGLPTAVTLAAESLERADTLTRIVGGPLFRPYSADDPIGAQIGGSVKNVIAIACGIVQGREMGENARAALITRGLAEMIRLGVARGARPETLTGLSGLGDLTLTCTSLQSRNMSVGAAIGRGEALDAYLKGRKTIAEGIWTAKSVVHLGQKLKVDMPISRAVNAILHQGAEIEETIEALLSRPFKQERVG